ncbi:hypothetical protein LLO_2904 [Legionella longbeachae NSW150]|uniref:Uncharacterized protein n=1 Tax=Legionella longbeachae serogroup 1 (strain NSW150) TaxID=661367 RepID=D3HLM3_LEGLN|nr:MULTISPECIES: hypothetical protein [Legionellaceae]CBJ13343.1 hypothetical protein LLO_2904 [Legionella longbeachae NSW150]
MNKTGNQRVLGYKKSTELSEEELGAVSGGSNSGLTHSRNLKATGDNTNPDARYDEVVDW